MAAIVEDSVNSSSGKRTTLRSTHGRLLLNELQQPSTARISEVLQCIRKDPHAGRLAMATGDNAFHLLVGSTYSHSFILPVLQELLKCCPEGLKMRNNSGNLPLHLCFTQYQLMEDITEMILAAYPQGAAVANDLGLIPLFLCVMREDTSAALCRALCRANPAGPSTMNKTHSYPLHFAAKRAHPNHEVLKILLRRAPAAASHVNGFGRLPMHCICEISDDIIAVQMVYEAFPEAVSVKDRQGRTCLHLAVLNVGKDHSDAVTKEEEELYLEAQRIHSKKEKEKQQELAAINEEDGDGVDPHDEIQREFSSLKKSMTLVETQEREYGKSRAVVKFLIEKWPAALVEFNNFLATPVDTVLEKTKSVRTKKKIVTVFGLYDDAPTARILLLSHVRYFKQQQKSSIGDDSNALSLPALRVKDAKILRELNWIARKEALLMSLAGEPAHQKKLIVENVTKGTTAKKGNIKKGKSLGSAGKSGADQLVTKMEKLTLRHGDVEIPKNNLLARLRRQGFIDLVMAVILFI